MEECPCCAEDVQDDAAPLEVIKAAPRSRDWYYYDPIDYLHGPFLINELKQAYENGMIGEYSSVANTKLLQKTMLKDSLIYGYVKGEQDLEDLKKSTGIADLYDFHKEEVRLKDKIVVAFEQAKKKFFSRVHQETLAPRDISG